MASTTHRPDENLALRVTRLEDLEALRTLKVRYAESVDRCMADPSEAGIATIVDLFATDAVANYAQFGVFEGHPAIATFFRSVLPSVVSWTRHYMTNPILEVDGTRATGRWSTTALGLFRDAPEAGPRTLYVRYEDTYVKTDGGWRFQSVTAIFDKPE